jgi:DNA-binding transcriptional ArsR family regulator
VAQTSAALSAGAPLFAALGDATRLRLVARLCAGGPQSIARLTAGSAVTRQAVSKHLLVLAGAGLVRGVRQGRESRWALEPGQLEVARRYLDLISERWTRRLEALERHLDSTAEPRPGARGRGKAPA